jgi:hypothetical protein
MVSPLFRFLRSPATNGGGVVPSRPSFAGPSPRELALERELAGLRREQAVLVRAERQAGENLERLRDELDILANEIDKRAKASRDRGLAERAAVTIANVKAWADKQDGCDIKPATVTTAILIALGLEASPHRVAPPLGAVVPIDPAKRAAEIVAAGRKARAETPAEMPSDPTAAGIVAAGKRARNEPTDE